MSGAPGTVLRGLHDLLLMRERMQRLTEDIKIASSHVQDHEIRLVRLETMVEMAGANRQRPRRLPPS